MVASQLSIGSKCSAAYYTLLSTKTFSFFILNNFWDSQNVIISFQRACVVSFIQDLLQLHYLLPKLLFDCLANILIYSNILTCIQN